MIRIEDAGAWIFLAFASGIVVGMRLQTFLHFRKLLGILCEKCLRSFWEKYDRAD